MVKSSVIEELAVLAAKEHFGKLTVDQLGEVVGLDHATFTIRALIGKRLRLTKEDKVFPIDETRY